MNYKMAMGTLGGCIGVMAALFAGQAAAAGMFAGLRDNVDISLSGFLRAEGTYRTTDEQNPNNQNGNVFNNRTLSRQAYAPPNLVQTQLDNLCLGATCLGDLVGVGEVGTWNTLPLPGFSDEVRRGDFIQHDENDTNYTVLRAEAELGVRMGYHWRFIARARALFDPTIYDEFDARDVADVQSGISGGDPDLYHGLPSYFEYRVENGRGGYRNGNQLEFTGREYFVDFPALLLEYTGGPLTVRVGNQQIAWGQAIFFRVLDVPNGLDLRRHSILDRGLEEFSDKRVPMLSARVMYQLPFNIVADAYVGRFQPTVFGNPNTGYNVIPAQFTVQDMFHVGGYDDKISYGLRLKGDYGKWGWQAIAVRRWNPDGTFRWTESNNEQSLDGGLLGQAVNAMYALNSSPECGATTGEALSHSAFEAAPGGVYSAEEWFYYAAHVRLAGLAGLNASIEDFPCAQALTASPVDLDAPDAMAQGSNQLNTFFMAAGGSLRGHIARDFHQENVFGLGASYVLESDNNFLNQLIFNLEAAYQPKRSFTNITLGQEPIVEDEVTVALVVDKWHRFLRGFPGTYIVGQVMWKNESDLVGRHLSGYGASQDNGDPPGVSNATYVVFGFLQPFPNKIWEVEFASLIDPRGGVFAQPGLRWNPGRNITVEGFYNYANGDLSGNPNDNLISTLNFAEEVTLRLTWQF